MSIRSVSVNQSAALAPSRAERLRAMLVALSLGFALVYLAGFAYSAPAHNAAHDSRHTLGFPCH